MQRCVGKGNGRWWAAVGDGAKAIEEVGNIGEGVGQLSANSLSDVIERMAREKLPNRSTMGSYVQQLSYSFLPRN